MSTEHVYMSLAEQHEDSDARWAFGTGFTDPLHGVDTALTEGADGAALAADCLALGDDALIAAQRLAEWCTLAPELEEEMALANIGLDLLGQARMLYARAGQADGSGRGEDAYAYFRGPSEFRNARLTEIPNGDFAFSIGRLLVLSTWRLAIFERLAGGAGTADPVLRAIAAKGVKELTYHRQYAAEWTVRLGDGTEESHLRMRAALDLIAPWLPELFADPLAARLGAATDTADTATATADVADETIEVLTRVLTEAGLALRDAVTIPGSGRAGAHTDHLAVLLAELQSVARADPEATW